MLLIILIRENLPIIKDIKIYDQQKSNGNLFKS